MTETEVSELQIIEPKTGHEPELVQSILYYNKHTP
jgi:hypothetical protein